MGPYGRTIEKTVWREVGRRVVRTIARPSDHHPRASDGHDPSPAELCISPAPIHHDPNLPDPQRPPRHRRPGPRTVGRVVRPPRRLALARAACGASNCTLPWPGQIRWTTIAYLGPMQKRLCRVRTYIRSSWKTRLLRKGSRMFTASSRYSGPSARTTVAPWSSLTKMLSPATVMLG